MKKVCLVTLAWITTLALLGGGCVVHEHSATCSHYYGHGHWVNAPHHVHGPSCGHMLRGGVWVTVP